MPVRAGVDRRRRSVVQANPAGGVEQVDVARLGDQVHRVATLGGTTAVNAGEERLVANLVTVCADLLHTLGGAVDVGVGAELFDDVDRDLQAGSVGGQVEVFGADTCLLYTSPSPRD